MRFWAIVDSMEKLSREEEKLIEEIDKVTKDYILVENTDAKILGTIYDIEDKKPDVILFVSNEKNIEIASSLSLILNVGVSQNVFGVFKGEDNKAHFLRPVYDNMLLAETEGKSTHIATLKLTGISKINEWNEDLLIDDAEIVVTVGKGVILSDTLNLAKELAKVLNASIGATRVVTDMQVLPIAKQIGQTGKYIRPRIYIGLGVSGSVQHMAGMRNSDIIIAINNDRRAPIFEHADYGIVGDLKEVLPLLIKELSSYLN